MSLATLQRRPVPASTAASARSNSSTVAVAQRAFWDRFFEAGNDGEWYIPSSVAMQHLAPFLPDASLVVHGGAGASLLVHKLEERAQGVVLHFDFSEAILQKIRSTGSTAELAVVDAFHMPLKDDIVDMFVEKGLFDSITAETRTREPNAAAYLAELHRVLRPGGRAFVFSMFGPDSEDKDSLGLLNHDGLSVGCEHLPHAPFEKPDQHFTFVYTLVKQL